MTRAFYHEHPDVLAIWEREQTFEALRAKNRDGEKFSFIDGPVTANKANVASLVIKGGTGKK